MLTGFRSHSTRTINQILQPNQALSEVVVPKAWCSAGDLQVLTGP